MPTTTEATEGDGILNPGVLDPSISEALAATLKGVRTGATAQVANSIALTRTEQGKLQQIMSQVVSGLGIPLGEVLKTLDFDTTVILDEYMSQVYPGLVGFPNVETVIRKSVEDVKMRAHLTKWSEKQRTYMDEAGVSSLSLQRISVLIEQMERHFEERSQILLPTTNTEGLFQQKIEQLRTQRNTLQSALDSDLSRRFGILLNTLSLELSEILFSNFLATIYDRPTYKALVALLKVMSPLVRTTQEHELEMAISQHQSVLEGRERASLKQREEEQTTNRREIKKVLRKLSENIVSQTTIEAVEKMRDTGTLAGEIAVLIKKLSSASEQSQFENEVGSIFEGGISKLRIKNKTITGSVELSPEVRLKMFAPEPPKELQWQIKYKLDGGMVNIYFEDSVMGKRINPHGGIDNHQNAKHVWDPKYPLRVPEPDFREMMKYVKRGALQVRKLMNMHGVNGEPLNVDGKKVSIVTDTVDAEHAKKYGYLARILDGLPKTNTDARTRVPILPSTATIGPTALKFFQSFEELAQIQLSSRGEGNGIIKIEGDAGTGKNYKLDMYAAMTNREVFEMSGNRTATKGDLLFTHEIGPDGTYRASSDLIRGIQTPGAIIVLDEINAYPPEVIKLLNPLTDGRRCINDPQAGKIRCHTTVIICSASNPSHYIGTAPFPMELKSRARDITDEYPWLYLSDGTVSWEEAETMRQHAHKSGLAKMSHEEFVQKWTDSFKRNPAVWQFPAGMQELLVGIFHLLKFAKDMREIYQKTCRGEDGIEFHYPINLRDNIQIVYEFERGGRTFKEAVSNVLMPKISGKPIDLNVEEEKSLLKTKLDEYFK